MAALLAASLACTFPIRPPALGESEVAVTPTVTALSTSTATPSPLLAVEAPTDTPTTTATLTPTPTLGPPTTTTTMNANCRSGPGLFYDVVRVLLAGTTEGIVGKEAPGSWWVVQHGTRCWVSAITGTAAGDLSRVPVIPGPPTPTLRIFLPPPRTIVLPPLVSGANVTADPTTCMPCPCRATWHGSITGTGPLTASYVWEYKRDSGSWQEAPTHWSLAFSGAGTLNTVDTSLEVLSGGSFTETVRLHVTAPNSVYSNEVMVTINCTP